MNNKTFWPELQALRLKHERLIQEHKIVRRLKEEYQKEAKQLRKEIKMMNNSQQKEEAQMNVVITETAPIVYDDLLDEFITPEENNSSDDFTDEVTFEDYVEENWEEDLMHGEFAIANSLDEFDDDFDFGFEVEQDDLVLPLGYNFQDTAVMAWDNY